MMTHKYKMVLEFPHTTVSSFIECVKNFIQSEVYNFQTINISTFQKEIQYLLQLRDKESIDVGIRIPYLLLTPTITEPVTQADTFWRSSQKWPYLSAYFYQPVIKHDMVWLYVVTRRFTGTIEMRIFADSLMELHDIQLAFTDTFYGINMQRYLPNMSLGIIIPDTIKVMFSDGVEVIDWRKTNYTNQLIPSVDKTFGVITTKNPPMIKLENIADASQYFGGTGLPEFALSGMLRYELEIPVYLLILTHAEVTGFSGSITTELIQVPTDTALRPNLVAIKDKNNIVVIEPSFIQTEDSYNIDNCIIKIELIGNMQNASDIVVIIAGLQIPSEFYEVDGSNVIIRICDFYNSIGSSVPHQKEPIEIIYYKRERCPSWIKTQSNL